MAKRSLIPVHRLTESTDKGFALEWMHADSERVKEAMLMDAHRDDHYIFILMESGWCKMMVDFRPLTVKENSLLFVLPGQVHDYHDAALGATGWFIALDPGLVPELFRTVLEDPFLEQKPRTMDADSVQPLLKCLQLIDILQAGPESVYSRLSLHTLLASFTGMVADLHAGKSTGAEVKTSRSKQITREFRQLVAQRFRTLKSPGEYAASLHVSLSWLNEVVKETTGFTVSYWIQQEIMLEAKRLLYYSQCNVKEIAYELGYEDPTYFSRLFKKVAGRTPGDFRELYRK